MAREIKFRGKRIDNGEWMYGDLIHREPNGVRNYIYPYFDPMGCILNHTEEVIPETVGQYTGLKDKNGKEIYESDILDITSEMFTDFGKRPTGRLDTTYKQVIWKEDGWATKTLISKSSVVGSELKGIAVTAKFGVVAGNIYENPELLKGGEKGGIR